MHNLLTNSTDLLRVATGSAADVDAVVSFVEYTNNASPPVLDPMDTEYTTAITTATSTTILSAPSGSTKRRRIKAVSLVNTHASVSTTVRVFIQRSGPVEWTIFNTVTLQPGESVTYSEGTGWFPNKNVVLAPSGSVNFLTGGDLSLSTTDVYMTNSNIKLDGMGAPTIGRIYLWRFIVAKTAGTAAPVITVRTGTAGTTADTSRVVYTWGIGTSVADTAEIELEVGFISVGSGTSAVLRGKANMTNNLSSTLTGFSGTTAIKALQPADSGGFDSTAAGLIIGLSFNGSTAFSGTMQYMTAFTEQRV